MIAIDPTEFIDLVQPLLEAQDMAGLLSLLKSRWSCDQIVEVLRSRNTDAKKVAILAIGLVGPTCATEELVLQLKDADSTVHQLAEHALWSIWFRAGSAEANAELNRGAEAIDARDFEKAHAHFNKAIHINPDFAEAYNQRAIAYYLQEDFRRSADDCRRTVRRMPCHFGAWAGMGHCHAHLGRIDEAVEAYEKALSINPRLDCIRETVAELKRRRHRADG